ncbi:MAG: 1-acyl-sn-glycerol-3-phosphate acyltransferase [Candidatus Obscuribacterales bacterium]|nr:1-acyl-sn-glycerol-3-phosphate acyltransferase [Candidatus Obscuribacterales bacterium]
MNLISNHPWLFLSAVGTLLFASWYLFWKNQAARFEKSGYTPPATGPLGKFFFNAATRLLTFLTVGPVKVINGHKAPRKGKVIWAANHQQPCDFAMLRRGAGRHFRVLTAANELTGFFGVLGAWMGSISVAFKNKSDGAQAEASCVKVVAGKGGSLGIFPEGALLPDNPGLSEHFRPGAVRMARHASEISGEPVFIVPIAIYYKHDPKDRHWSHRFLAKQRASFPAARNPKSWNPIFKQDADALPPAERDALLLQRKEIMRAHFKNRATNYGGVIVVGDAINQADLPVDPIEAAGVLRDKVAALLEEAKKH